MSISIRKIVETTMTDNDKLSISELISNIGKWEKSFDHDINEFIKFRGSTGPKDWSPYLYEFLDIVTPYSLESLESRASFLYIKCYINWMNHKLLPMITFIKFKNKVGVMLCFLLGYHIDTFKFEEFQSVLLSDLDIAYLLIEAGLDLSPYKERLWIFLVDRIRCAKFEFVEFMIDVVNVDVIFTSYYVKTILREALFNTIEVVEFLIDRGADVNALNWNVTPLLYALLHDLDLEKLKLLIKNGATLGPVNRGLPEECIDKLRAIGYTI